MMPYGTVIALLALLVLCSAVRATAEPLRLHPENPHYFLFRGRPAVLITSGEHYGAVLNADFDYTKYLDALAADGLNNTRMFVGAYCEPVGAFNIAHNTLAPAAGRFVCPWARSDRPGYVHGGNKFDLTQWDEGYFTRLKDFVSKAAARGIVVEVNLFCPFYKEDMWVLSPMNAQNNVNGVGDVSGEDAYTLDRHGGLLSLQEAMVRKIVAELKEYDNLYYEVMNEPYARKVPMEWQRHIIDAIVAAEKELDTQHLISLNIANHKAEVENLHPAVSILNFHYAWPPETVAMNYALNRVLGDNETGFKGTGDFHYRRESWAFILAGGALYNNLDYSFTVGHEDGTFEYPPTQPGGGTAALREQLRILSEFIHGFDFVRMVPDHTVIRGGLPEGTAAYALAEAGKQYAVYICRLGDESPTEDMRVQLRLDLPNGTYRAEWVNTLTGKIDRSERLTHEGVERTLESSAFEDDVALRVMARQ